MMTRKGRPCRAALLLIASAAVFPPHGTTAAPTPLEKGSKTEPGAYQTVIVVDDHCPPTIIVSYNPNTGTLNVAIISNPVCPIGTPVFTAYAPDDPAASSPDRLGFTKVPLRFFLRATHASRHRKRATFAAALKPGPSLVGKDSLLLKIHYSQTRAMRGGKKETISPTVYTTILLADMTSAAAHEAAPEAGKP